MRSLGQALTSMTGVLIEGIWTPQTQGQRDRVGRGNEGSGVLGTRAAVGARLPGSHPSPS